MKKAQGRTLGQMALAANTPTMLRSGLVDGDTRRRCARLGPGGRRHRRPADLRGAHRPDRPGCRRRAAPSVDVRRLTDPSGRLARLRRNGSIGSLCTDRHADSVSGSHPSQEGSPCPQPSRGSTRPRAPSPRPRAAGPGRLGRRRRLRSRADRHQRHQEQRDHREEDQEERGHRQEDQEERRHLEEGQGRLLRGRPGRRGEADRGGVQQRRRGRLRLADAGILIPGLVG